VIVTAIALTLGAVVAWWLRTTEGKLVRAVLWAAVLCPFCLSVILKNYAFIFILRRRGIVNDALHLLGLVDEPQTLLYSTFAVTVGMLYTMLPYAVLPIYAGFRSIDLDLVRAAESLGSSRTGALASILIPLAAPSLLASGVLVFVVSLGFFVTPVLLGGAGALFIASVIRDDIFRRFDYSGAAASATLLLAIALVSVGLAWAILGGERLKRAAT
jgi:putative spermidine/putrescine transport system permease protein